jgi:hypothetical protein
MDPFKKSFGKSHLQYPILLETKRYFWLISQLCLNLLMTNICEYRLQKITITSYGYQAKQ